MIRAVVRMDGWLELNFIERTFPMNEQKAGVPIVISADDARGANGPDKGTVGDTLLPMLISLIVFTALGVSIVAYLVRN